MCISQTVTHFLNKCGFSYTFDSLSKFRDHHSNILKEIGKISIAFLNKDKMVFFLTDLQKSVQSILHLCQIIRVHMAYSKKDVFLHMTSRTISYI